MEALSEVRRLPIRDLAQPSDQAACDHALLSLDDADLKPGVLWSLKHLMPVETIECLGCVVARDLAVDQDRAPARMEVGETRQVVDFCIYDDPLQDKTKGSGWKE